MRGDWKMHALQMFRGKIRRTWIVRDAQYPTNIVIYHDFGLAIIKEKALKRDQPNTKCFQKTFDRSGYFFVREKTQIIWILKLELILFKNNGNCMTPFSSCRFVRISVFSYGRCWTISRIWTQNYLAIQSVQPARMWHAEPTSYHFTIAGVM